ncbi:FHA domain-containing protein [Planctomicrobium sp. SH527]|uniref:FHA domain-containing protein n=1 Tax=Planctomicrobium sp. SH527 TaxID=3448123 RepID=UPI003F5B9D9C
MKWSLVPLDGSAPIILDRAILFFGRGQECDIVITTSRKVSRKHCCVAQIDDRFVIRDLGSMNGVRVNDTRVVTEASLNIDDTLWVGDVGFRVAKAGQPASKKAPLATVAPAVAVHPPALADQYPSSDLPVVIAIPESFGPPSHMIPHDEVESIDDEEE